MAFSRRDRRRHWTVAIDTHNVSYYGSRSTSHIVGGEKKQGTNYFYSYATAILIHRHRRTPWSCRSAEYRLLLQGLSLILRQVWVFLTEEIARSRCLKPSAWMSELPMVEMLEWLADAIKTPNVPTRCITINSMTITTTKHC